MGLHFKYIIWFGIFFGFTLLGNSQDKIITMSGDVIQGKVVDDTQIVIKYTIKNKRGKIKEREIHKSDVFSVTKEGEEEHVYYMMDELLGDNFSVENTRIFITGEMDGDKYNTKRIEAIGYVLGAAGGYFSKANIIVVLATPTLYTIYQYIPYIKVKENTMTDVKYKGDKNYLRGYEITARENRLRKAFRSSVIGTVVGVVLYRFVPFS